MMASPYESIGSDECILNAGGKPTQGACAWTFEKWEGKLPLPVGGEGYRVRGVGMP